MTGSDEILLAYARLIRSRSGASSVSLYLPGAADSNPLPSVVQEGDGPPVPELADAQRAEAFARANETGPDGSMPPIHNSSDETCGLVPVPTIEDLLALAAGGRRGPERRRGRPEGVAWLGLRFSTASELARMQGVMADSRDGTGEVDPRERWAWLLAVGGTLAWHNRWVAEMVSDPISRLPGRTVLENTVRIALQHARLRDCPATLILINPDDFILVNRCFGREAGDTVVREIAERLCEALRRTDCVCRYGGAVFGVVLSETPPEEATAVAAKLFAALTEGAYLEGGVRLGFSIGVAGYVPAPSESVEESALTLTRRADAALNVAKRSGGGRLVTWRSGVDFDEAGPHDRLSGVFTANLSKDYRNMLLLWDAVSIVAASRDLTELASPMLRRLAEVFAPDRLALFERGEDGGTRIVSGLELREADGPPDPSGWVRFALDHASLLHQALETRSPALQRPAEPTGVAGYAVPLLAGDACLGWLYLEGAAQVLALDSSDLIFLGALGRQLGVALDRARLAERERRREEVERERLAREVKELREALQRSRLVHRSGAMESLLSDVRRVAATDATVLIHGETGTGKEMISRILHELSDRCTQPLVVVDCAAIATSLIDSELFGHERGAFTGAEQRSEGRLGQADRGTVLLDEIGELPLDVQSKLLRFVQEKQYTPVGGSRPRRVDVRVVAATNRDLETEVAAGRFREDLYHRLNVVRLHVPPLRDRLEDVLPLARHFLHQFAAQYGKQVRALRPRAEELLLGYSWPGNVRELENRMMRAVILCPGEEIGPAELELVGPAETATPRPAVLVPLATAPPTPPSLPPEQAWEELRVSLDRAVQVALLGSMSPAAPLGKWLADDLVLEAHAATDGVFSRAALRLGIPETTLRRRYRGARGRTHAVTRRSPPEWESVRAHLSRIAADENADGGDRLGRATNTLLEVVRSRTQDDPRMGASLMGVTETTFRRWAGPRGVKS